MSKWSLPVLLESLHEDLQNHLTLSRKSFAHPGTKGDVSEGVWLQLLQRYLPQRYQANKAHVVDSHGNFSDQIDIVIFDRQYSPFIFNFEGELIIPAESVYAVFEAKQVIDAGMIDYAHKKAASVRRLHRTSLPIPHAGGVYPPKPLMPIFAGILALESNWTPPLGKPLSDALNAASPEQQLNIGCVAAHGFFTFDEVSRTLKTNTDTKPATAFLFALISHLQKYATVPMIDIDAYGSWLAPDLHTQATPPKVKNHGQK